MPARNVASTVAIERANLTDVSLTNTVFGKKGSFISKESRISEVSVRIRLETGSI